MLPMMKARYIARAIGCSLGVAKTGTHQIAITCEIVNPPEFEGALIPWIGNFTDRATDRTIDFLRAFGWYGDDLCELEDLDASHAAMLLPDQVEITVEPEMYDNETRLKVKWVNKPGASFAFKEPLNGQNLKAFASQMRGLLRGTRQNQPSLPSKQSKHPNAPDNDDIPF